MCASWEERQAQCAGLICVSSTLQVLFVVLLWDQQNY